MKVSKVLSLIIAVVLLATTAQSALPVQVSAASFTPQDGVLFNNPTSTDRAKQYRLVTQLTRTIDSAPKGSTIRASLYSINLPGFTQHLINAHKRGVRIHLLMNGRNASTPQWKRLQRALGTRTTAASFAVTCAHGCFDTNAGSLMHAKLYTFSAAGSARYVSMVSSGNPTSTQAQNGWNNLDTVVDNQGLYQAYVDYFTAMVRSARINDTIDYYHKITSGNYETILSPAQSSATQPNYYAQALDHISCKAGGGYGGKNGNTQVRVIMSLWTDNNVGLARRLVALDDAGCDVRIIISAHGTGTTVQKVLEQSTKHGGIVLRNASQDLNHDGIEDHYTHQKVLMVNGKYDGKNTKLVWTGSHNFSYNAMYGNNDIILRIESAARYDAYQTQFNFESTKFPLMHRKNSNRAVAGDAAANNADSAIETPLPDLESPDAYQD